MAIIAGLFATLFGRLLGPRRGALAALLGIGAYTLLVGAGPAVVRAAIMGGLSLFARQVGRRQHGLNSLALVAAGMAFFNPHLPWDVSFQLSFTATLGLILYAGPLTQAFERLITSEARFGAHWSLLNVSLAPSANTSSSPWLPNSPACRWSSTTSSDCRSARCWPTP